MHTLWYCSGPKARGTPALANAPARLPGHTADAQGRVSSGRQLSKCDGMQHKPQLPSVLGAGAHGDLPRDQCKITGSAGRAAHQPRRRNPPSGTRSRTSCRTRPCACAPHGSARTCLPAIASVHSSPPLACATNTAAQALRAETLVLARRAQSSLLRHMTSHRRYGVQLHRGRTEMQLHGEQSASDRRLSERRPAHVQRSLGL